MIIRGLHRKILFKIAILNQKKPDVLQLWTLTVDLFLSKSGPGLARLAT
jgi:hypothetical protein